MAAADSADAYAQDESLSGKRVLITGGTQGLGAATAQRLQRAGADVLVTARSAPVAADGPSFIAADLSTTAGVDTVARHVQQHFGGLDILIHNLGATLTSGRFDDVNDEQWTAILNTVLLAAVRLDRALVPAMITAGEGVVVHVTSIQRRMPLTGVKLLEGTAAQNSLPLSAAKAALAAYSKGLATEVAPTGVRVNTVAPGFILTPATDQLAQQIAEQTGTDKTTALNRIGAAVTPGGIPLGRPVTADEVAELIAFLSSTRSSGIVGTEYVIDGGSTPTL